MLEVFVTLSFSIDFLSRCRAGAQVLAGGEVVKVSSEKDPMGPIGCYDESPTVQCRYFVLLVFEHNVRTAE